MFESRKTRLALLHLLLLLLLLPLLLLFLLFLLLVLLQLLVLLVLLLFFSCWCSCWFCCSLFFFSCLCVNSLVVVFKGLHHRRLECLLLTTVIQGSPRCLVFFSQQDCARVRLLSFLEASSFASASYILSPVTSSTHLLSNPSTPGWT